MIVDLAAEWFTVTCVSQKSRSLHSPIDCFAAQAADIVGARAVLVHAIDERARKFYEHFDFEASPVHELQLMLLMKDLRRALE